MARRARRRTVGTLAQRAAALAAEDAPNRDSVLALLAEHPYSDGLLCADYRTWTTRRRFPGPSGAYLRYLLLFGQTERVRAVEEWLNLLDPSACWHQQAVAWAGHLPALADPQGRTFAEIPTA